MDVQTKILQLRNNIAQSLKMVIGRKCILLDVPYYHNIGDVLIWKGEMSFYQNITYNACIMPRMKLVLFLK